MEEPMEKNKFSLSALVNAYYRGYHATYDTPRIFDDFLAAQFLTEEERASFDRQFVTALQGGAPALAGSFPDQAATLAWIMQRWTSIPLVVSRARYAEDSLEKAAELLSIHKIHRLLVTDESNEAVGIVSLADLVIEIAAQNSRIALQEMTEAGKQEKVGGRIQHPAI